MSKYARFAAAVLALGMTGFGDQPAPPVLLACNGDFGKFANGFLVARPMELNFVVDWQKPVVATSSGNVGRIITLTPYELSFEIQYDGYKVIYDINRIEGTIRQWPNIGGVFSGRCEEQPLRQKF